MLLKLFSNLTIALEKSPYLAVGAAFIWGILSIILSPCHLSSIPLIVGFLSGQKKITFRKAFLYSLFFSVGILISILVIGIITGIMGRIIGDIGIIGNIIISLMFIIVGLFLLDVISLNFLNKFSIPQFKKGGLLISLVIGLIFGTAVGPCTFSYMMPLLGVVFKSAANNLIFAVILVASYAVGHCSVIIAAGSSFKLIEKLLKWNEKSITVKIIKKICGILVILGGIYLISDAVINFLRIKQII